MRYLIKQQQVPRPEWLKNALDAMQARYPEDRFDVVLRKTTDPNVPAEWRVKCLDCPGKVGHLFLFFYFLPRLICFFSCTRQGRQKR